MKAPRPTTAWLIAVIVLLVAGAVLSEYGWTHPLLDPRYHQFGLMLVLYGVVLFWWRAEAILIESTQRFFRRAWRMVRAPKAPLTPVQKHYHKVMHLDRKANTCKDDCDE